MHFIWSLPACLPALHVYGYLVFLELPDLIFVCFFYFSSSSDEEVAVEENEHNSVEVLDGNTGRQDVNTEVDNMQKEESDN